MLEQISREAGIDMHEQVPQPPVALDAVRVHRAGLRAVRALTELHAPVDLASEALTDAADETFALWSLLVAKAARVLSYTVDFDADVWAQDAEPNLLLMEHVRGRFSRVLGLDPSRCRAVAVLHSEGSRAPPVKGGKNL